MMNKKLKEFWERNKSKIFIGVGGTILAISTINFIIKLRRYSNFKSFTFKGIDPSRVKPTREIPDVEGFKILDIGEDINDGCVVWFDGCELLDCGKLGEELCKIDRIDPKTLITLAILSHEKLEL